MIQLQSLAFGPFPEAEPLNPRFAPGHVKLRLTVDTELSPHVSAEQVLVRLAEAFPNLARHECRMDREPEREDSRGILLLEDEPSANLAHLLEHLILEILSMMGPESRLSGVTCAYASPPQRNDVFVECNEAGLGALVSFLATETLNAALASRPVLPLYSDASLCARALLESGEGARWTPGDMARAIRVTPDRAAAALDVLCRLGVLDSEPYAMNFSGEPNYRFAGMKGFPSLALAG